MNDNYFSGSIPFGLFQRPQNATQFEFFDFSKNRLDICLLPQQGFVVPSNISSVRCKVGSQTPTECGCVASWPSNCVSSIISLCPPSAPVDPFPVAPFNLNPSPMAPHAPSGTSPSPSPFSGPSVSPTSNSKRMTSSSFFVFVLASFVALVWALT